MHRLFGHIEDDDMRRDLEQAVVEGLDSSDTTVLTNCYMEESQEYILQLSTYNDDDLYGGEIVIPDKETYEGHQVDFFRVQIEDTVRAIDEAIESG